MTVGAPIGVAIGRPIGRLIGAGADGSWSANFLAGEFPSNITFTRASSAQDFNDPALTYATNVPVLTSSGLLLQGARTNLLLNSATLSTQNVTTTNVAHTLSFYGTGTVTLSGTSTAGPLVGTGASNRVTLTFTPTAGTLTLTVTGTVTQAQLEVGAFASSYIPTTGSAVTRAPDVATISNLASMGFDATGGTMLAEFNTIGESPTASVYMFNNNSTANEIGYRRQTGTPSNGFAYVRNANVDQASYVGAANAGVTYKSCLAWQSNNINHAINGVLGTLDTSATIPTVDRLMIGRSAASTSELFGYLRRLTYFPTRLPDATLQALTA